MTQTIVWASVGILLAIAELMSGAFFLLFFGLAALLVAGLRLLGLDHLNSEIAIFALLSAGLVLTFRKKLVHSLSAKGAWKDEQNFVVDQSLEPNKQTSIQYQGTTWTAINDSSEVIASGSEVKITRKDGIKLFVKKV